MTVIATGGLAPLFFERAGLFNHLDPDLTMAGLLEIYERNRERVRAGKRKGQK